VLDAVSHLVTGETLDIDVDAKLPDNVAPGRLIAYRLPDEAVERARQRLRREKGSEPSARTLEAAKYVLLFTTAVRARLDAGRCLRGYRLRWQIELQFKRWKSLCGFDLLPNWRDDTTLAWLYAKVLLGALLDRILLGADRVSGVAFSIVLRVAGLDDEIRHDAEPPQAVEVAAVRQIQKVGDGEWSPFRIQPHNEGALGRFHSDAGMGTSKRAVQVAGAAEPEAGGTAHLGEGRRGWARAGRGPGERH